MHSYVFAVDAICFPSDALVRKLISPGQVSTIRMDQVAIGDQIECLKPSLGTDALVESFTAAFCDVYYYNNVQHVSLCPWLFATVGRVLRALCINLHQVDGQHVS